MSKSRFAVPLAAVAVAALLGAALLGCKPRGTSAPADPSRPYVGTWRMPTSNATWTLNADGTCVINGKSGTYTEANGVIQVSGGASHTVSWQVSDGGRKLTLTHTSRSSGRSFPAEFERQ